ncbi:hypothetical protein MMC30_007790 [Trapelia coarctata]|nr:hypothetical protein [Trapelia coarctata]
MIGKLPGQPENATGETVQVVTEVEADAPSPEQELHTSQVASDDHDDDVLYLGRIGDGPDSADGTEPAMDDAEGGAAIDERDNILSELQGRSMKETEQDWAQTCIFYCHPLQHTGRDQGKTLLGTKHSIRPDQMETAYLFLRRSYSEGYNGGFVALDTGYRPCKDNRLPRRRRHDPPRRAEPA